MKSKLKSNPSEKGLNFSDTFIWFDETLVQKKSTKGLVWEILQGQEVGHQFLWLNISHKSDFSLKMITNVENFIYCDLMCSSEFLFSDFVQEM